MAGVIHHISLGFLSRPIRPPMSPPEICGAGRRRHMLWSYLCTVPNLDRHPYIKKIWRTQIFVTYCTRGIQGKHQLRGTQGKHQLVNLLTVTQSPLTGSLRPLTPRWLIRAYCTALHRAARSPSSRRTIFRIGRAHAIWAEICLDAVHSPHMVRR